MKGRPPPSERQVIASNRAARFHYEIFEQYEAGLVLRGSEVKSLREGKANLSEAYGAIERGEAWLRQLHIAAYPAARAFPHAERGVRKLLLHQREIEAIERAVHREGFAFVPLALYIVRGLIKATMAIARGKKAHDKRAALLEKTVEREALIAVRRRR